MQGPSWEARRGSEGRRGGARSRRHPHPHPPPHTWDSLSLCRPLAVAASARRAADVLLWRGCVLSTVVLDAHWPLRLSPRRGEPAVPCGGGRGKGVTLDVWASSSVDGDACVARAPAKGPQTRAHARGWVPQTVVCMRDGLVPLGRGDGVSRARAPRPCTPAGAAGGRLHGGRVKLTTRFANK